MNRIRTLRKERGLTQDDLAEAMGCNKSKISKLEKGSQQLSAAWLKKISTFFGVPAHVVDPSIEPVGLSDAAQESYVVEMAPSGTDGWCAPRASEEKAQGALVIRASYDIGRIRTGDLVRCDETATPAVGDVVYLERQDGRAVLGVWRGTNGMGPLIDMLMAGTPVLQNIAWAFVKRVARAMWVGV